MMQILYIFTSGPYSNAQGQEGLDALLMGANFDLRVAGLFLHDGVFQLKSGQTTSGSKLKQYTKTFLALQDFGIQEIYTHDHSLMSRGFDNKELMIDAKVLDSKAISELIRSSDRVFNF